MSGLLALLDDVAAIAKVVAASVDDVVGQAVKASSKAAGAVIDDAAVTPKYLHGFSAEREIPIVPLLVQDATLPQEHELPPALAALSTYDSVHILPDSQYDLSMAHLTGRLEPTIPTCPASSRNPRGWNIWWVCTRSRRRS